MIDLCLLTQKNQTLWGVIGRNIALWQNLWVGVGRFERRSSSARASLALCGRFNQFRSPYSGITMRRALRIRRVFDFVPSYTKWEQTLANISSCSQWCNFTHWITGGTGEEFRFSQWRMQKGTELQQRNQPMFWAQHLRLANDQEWIRKKVSERFSVWNRLSTRKTASGRCWWCLANTHANKKISDSNKGTTSSRAWSVNETRNNRTGRRAHWMETCPRCCAQAKWIPENLPRSTRPKSSTQTLHTSVPTNDEILPDMTRAKVFTKCDVRSRFWHVQLDKESADLTTSGALFGRFRWNRMPFGIAPAWEIFQKKLEQALEGLEGVRNIHDDIVI